jgi:hypothetical protein
MHGLDYRGRCDCFRVRKAFQERRQTEAMIAVSMRYVDRLAILHSHASVFRLRGVLSGRRTTSRTFESLSKRSREAIANRSVQNRQRPVLMSSEIELNGFVKQEPDVVKVIGPGALHKSDL